MAAVKNPFANSGSVRDAGLIPQSGRSPGEGNGNPLQYSCLENLLARRAWQARVRDNWAHTYTQIIFLGLQKRKQYVSEVTYSYSLLWRGAVYPRHVLKYIKAAWASLGMLELQNFSPPCPPTPQTYWFWICILVRFLGDCKALHWSIATQAR